MKWPFISREMHDLHVAAWEHQLERSEQRYADLLTHYHALKVQGAQTAEAPAGMPQREMDPVVKAITEASAGKPAGIRNLMLKQVMRDRSMGMDEDEILDRIYRGIAVEDGLPA